MVCGLLEESCCTFCFCLFWLEELATVPASYCLILLSGRTTVSVQALLSPFVMTHQQPDDVEMETGSVVDYGSLSEQSVEADPEASPADIEWEHAGSPYTALSFEELCSKLVGQILPNDAKERQCLDIPVSFELGDPHVHYNAHAAKAYDTSGEIGGPDWHALFLYILDHCVGLQQITTIFLLVDNRNLASEHTTDASLRHWPAVAAWWKSRVAMIGPSSEVSDLLFVPICKASGLDRTHPTWAGTFVLAAMCLVFPGKHIVLLDSDCIPVTLFEVGDFWREAWLARVTGLPCCTRDCSGTQEAALNAPLAELGNVPAVGQGVLLVTEHKAEVNAGFIVLFGSSHTAIVTVDDWKRLPPNEGEARRQALRVLRDKLVDAYWERVQVMIANGRTQNDMSQEECQAWVQTGLALAPFCGYPCDTTLDWAIIWSLVGEWTCRELFPPPPDVEGKRVWPGNATLRNFVRLITEVCTTAHLGKGML